MSRLLATVLTMVLAIAAMPAHAAIVSAQATAPEAAPPPPYEDQLLRLSEILGAVHYLRHLCKNDEGDVWRVQMEKLIETEAPDESRRARMVDRFNRGYESYRSVYLSCTLAASESSERYLQEGAKIAAEITARYGK
jgi:uncharacterized protein (TIGR02301 family)